VSSLKPRQRLKRPNQGFNSDTDTFLESGFG
jgi:hypothetical protein